MDLRFSFFRVVLFLHCVYTIAFEFRIENNKIDHSFRNTRQKRETDIKFGKDYLIKYGYVPPNAIISGDVMEQQQGWRNAIISMQNFFGLPETGELDEETINLMKKPRCGNPDKDAVQANLKRKKRYVKVGAKWHSNLVTYSINNFTPKLGKKKTHQAIDDAFAVWSRHSPLRFKKVSFEDDPDIVTFFAEGFHNDNTPFDGVGGFLAHAFYPGSGIGGDTHFDGAEQWTLFEKPYQGNDLFLVAVHEIGHALGLGHSTEITAIMAPVYRWHETKNFQLPQDDIDGIQSIYGKPGSEPNGPVMPDPPKPKPTTTTTTTTTKPRTPPRTKRPIRPRPRPTTTTTTKQTTTVKATEAPPPKLCKLKKYDAVSFLRQELYVFSGKYMWRRHRGSESLEGPFKISTFWPEVKNGVNAVYENQLQNRIVFFKDHLYWSYFGISLIENSPRPVRFLGLQNEHIGAAVWWERNGKTYLFQGSFYWRLKGDRIEEGYPKKITVWKGIPNDIDTAFSGIGEAGSNFTYFIKGTNYWKFDNWNIKVVGDPRSFRKDWLGCNSNDGLSQDDPSKNKLSNDEENVEKMSKATIPVIPIAVASSCFIVLLAVIIVIVAYKRKNLVAKPITVAINSTQTYSPGFPDHTEVNPKKTAFVTSAQQKMRLFRFSLQDQV